VSEKLVSVCHDKLYKQVVDQLQDLIITEVFRSGEKLPGERELAERLGVSRTVVREAIRVLSVRGLVQVKAGCGTYVRKPSPDDAAAPIELLLKLQKCPDFFDNLYEIRRTLEVEIAGIAAERATEEDHAVIEGAIDGMATHLDDLEQFVQYGLAFRSALAAATHNDLFSVLLSATRDLWFKGERLAYQSPGAAEGGLAHCREVLKRVKERDPERARQAMCDHICDSQRLVEAVRHQMDPLSDGVPDKPH
jgi:GntR family transcriptional repressor for pyruvate dehydrogenase complex